MDEETRTFSDIFTALRTSRSVWFKRVYGGTSVPFPLLWLGGPGSGFEPVVDVGLPVTAGILEDLQDAGIGKRCECCAAQSRAGQGAGSDSDSRSGLGSWVVDGAQVRSSSPHVLDNNFSSLAIIDYLFTYSLVHLLAGDGRERRGVGRVRGRGGRPAARCARARARTATASTKCYQN